MLAYHYEHGEVWDKALTFLVQAGQKAQHAYANHEALVHYDRALAVCERLGTAVDPSTLLTLYDGKGAVHFLRSEFHPAIDAYQRVLGHRTRSGSGRRRRKRSTTLALPTFGRTSPTRPAPMRSRRGP